MRNLLASLLLAMMCTGPASAHVTSTGLATLDVADGTLAYRLTVVAAEVDDQAGRLLVTAAEGDRAAAERVAGFLRDYARFSIANEPCRPGRISIRGAGTGDDKVVLEMALSCPKATGALAIRDDWPEVMGAHFQTVLSVRVPGRPSVEFVFLEDRRTATLDLATAAPTGWFAFIAMGVEHILGGVDHLLFLLALLALARGLWQTVTIVTGFTVAHSITLSLAVLGIVDVPSRIVEPLIPPGARACPDRLQCGGRAGPDRLRDRGHATLGLGLAARPAAAPAANSVGPRGRGGRDVAGPAPCCPVRESTVAFAAKTSVESPGC
jgi:hypothetical protein